MNRYIGRLFIALSACLCSFACHSSPPAAAMEGRDAGSQDSGNSADAGAPDTGNAVDGGSAITIDCEVLTLAFLGCDVERRGECERELSAVSSVNQALVATDIACLQMNFSSVANASWPDGTCSATAAPPVLSYWDQWLHGVCQGDNGNLASSIPADPAFPACSNGDGGGPQCFFGISAQTGGNASL